MITDELFERLWDPTVQRHHRNRELVMTDVPDGRLRSLLRKALDSLRIPDHVDIDVMSAPANTVVRGDETGEIRATTGYVCRTEDGMTGPVAEGLQHWINKHPEPITLFVYQLPLPQTIVDHERWVWRYAVRSGQGWRVKTS